MKIMYYPVVESAGINYLACNSCGKTVSTGFLAIKTHTPDKGLIVRANIQCPECLKLEMRIKNEGMD